MGLQKYRADFCKVLSNGVRKWYCDWMGGPTLAKIENCPTMAGPRMVYITGEPCTYFSLPAACKVNGQTIRGVVVFEVMPGCLEECPVFYAHTVSGKAKA